MPFLYEDKTRSKANEFIDALKTSKLNASIRENDFADYSAKIELMGMGLINLYYKPKTKTYKISLHELKRSAPADKIEEIWEQLNYGDQFKAKTRFSAFVDGSYIHDRVGYGAVILEQEHEVARFNGRVEKHVELRQVIGELKASLVVVKWCEANSVDEITLFYDYKGIEKWATGEWKAKNEATQNYRDLMQDSDVNVIWQKVKSHTGVRWNEVVDQLAKDGAVEGVTQQEANHVNSVDKVVDKVVDKETRLETLAREFIAFMGEQGVDGEFVKVYNNQYARIKVWGGYFDLYDTKKRPLVPYIHGYKNKSEQVQLQTWWDEFKATLS